MKKRAGLYIRVSTEEQVDNYSIPEQKRRLEAYCQSHDWAVAEEYIDGGFSGAKLDRPAMQKLITDTKAGNLDVVVSLKLDRLSRSQKDTLHLIEDIFLPCHVDYVSVNESFDTGTSFGRAMVGILSVFAQLEREQILERMHTGMEARVRSGLIHGGLPFGYDRKEKGLVINESQAAIVREIFDHWLKGYSYSEICRIMAQKYPGTLAWHAITSVIQILKNPVYIGKVNFNGEVLDGQHPPILDENIFEQAQVLIQTKTRCQGKQTHYLLSGIIWCAKCGERYGVRSSRQNGVLYSYYCCCPNRKRIGKEFQKKCRSKSWPTRKLDDIIINTIKKLAFDRQYFEELNAPVNNKVDNLTSLDKEITKCDLQIEKLMDLYTLDNLPLDKLNQRINALYEKKKKLEDELTKLRKSGIQTYEDYKEIFDSVETIFRSGDINQKKALVRSIIKRIEINDDDITIIFNFQNG